ncbi:hypothetical protein B4071_1263 [Bacillus subtilis]|uniref:Uncharacterized protein n=1 Tax=Bacillus subtilis subsp. subtilis TaxID=135461 RepID=A0ABD3ZR77_BACIU|nr:hypothetical protein B4067_1468 [Bacillus subtilis subsp. subtilis]KIN32034.1 hypothetical protein B4069_1260 [Bacillus subtilis]KIN42475.1 hypothetical protein B4071_1263 [Bacillus subtilis]KIN47700.1 hypothetical protein B4072_1409 [Bacillus subtilis]KIN59838.1 hypothetical protein B4145_1415 [Bacillus subtilis]
MLFSERVKDFDLFNCLFFDKNNTEYGKMKNWVVNIYFCK